MRVEVLVEDGLRSLSGWVLRDGGEPVMFYDWLSLLEILERLTSSGEPAAEGLDGELGAGGDPDLAEDVG